MKENLIKEKTAENTNNKRIDGHYISHEIEHLLHFDRGFFLTIRELLLRPGKTVREFLFGDRNKFVKPVLFLIFSALIFTLVMHFIHLDLTMFNIDGKAFKDGTKSNAIAEWTSNHTGYAQLIMGVFIAFWVKIFFRKFKYNIYEILVLLSFILGEALLILIFPFILFKIFNSAIILKIALAIYFLYIIWGIAQFFGEKKLVNYLKSSLTFLLGAFTYMATLKLISYLLTADF